MPNCKRALKYQSKNSLANSTCHGLGQISKAQGIFLKMFWLLATLIAAIAWIYFIVTIITNYYKHEVSTSIRVNYEFNSTFPSITVCSGSHFTTEYGAEFINATLNNKSSSDIVLNEFYIMQKYLQFRNDSNFKKLGDNLDKLVINAIFNWNGLNNSQEFSYLFHPLYGNCFTFNSESYENGSNRIPKRLIKTGISSGLYIDLNVSIYEELKKFFPNRGGVVLIHEFDTSPLTASPIFLPPQFDTYLALTRTKSIQMPKPYSNCDEGTDDPKRYPSDLYKTIHSSPDKYSQKLCFDLCLHRLIIQKCSCYLFLLTLANEGTPCSTQSQLQCVLNYYNEFMNSDSFTKICTPECPLECNTNIYSIVTSLQLSDYDPNFYKNVAGVRIYFEDFGITNIRESPIIDIGTLLASIGGLGGLFLGVSLLTLTELISFLLSLILILTKKIKIDEPKANAKTSST